MAFLGGNPDNDNGVRPNERGPHNLIIRVEGLIQPVMSDGAMSGINVHDQTELFLFEGSNKKECLDKLIEIMRHLVNATTEKSSN